MVNGMTDEILCKIKDRINQEIDELKVNGEKHSDDVRMAGQLIINGLCTALHIIQEVEARPSTQVIRITLLLDTEKNDDDITNTYEFIKDDLLSEIKCACRNYEFVGMETTILTKDGGNGSAD